MNKSSYSFFRQTLMLPDSGREKRPELVILSAARELAGVPHQPPCVPASAALSLIPLKVKNERAEK